jgi:hemerythrin
MALIWDDTFAMGVEEIDAQHRAIFDNFNMLSAACDEGAGTDRLMEMVDFMNTYSMTHFAAEEKLAEEYGYPGLDTQRDEHRLFAADLAEIRERITADGPSSDCVIALKGKLIKWLIHHIKHVDGELCAYIRERRA